VYNKGTLRIAVTVMMTEIMKKVYLLRRAMMAVGIDFWKKCTQRN